eukprot:TRINITY_DN4064_c0_g1_i1.p1 TRINITY_DN4064_c0_g1~~TRINITY_DN4064_c0_g1_i1.p1  ORF type:complete len:527 (-),score=103.97 TRINITY_DN4064_c0_g1_i1:126-1706(-)
MNSLYLLVIFIILSSSSCSGSFSNFVDNESNKPLDQLHKKLINFQENENISVVFPNNEEYLTDRLVWNQGIKQSSPICIIYCKNSDEVSKSVKFINQIETYNFNITVRSFSHDYEGYSVGTGTIVIDVSNIKGFKLEKKPSSVTIATFNVGYQAFEAYYLLSKEGYYFVGGSGANVGISGLTLGGGYGFLSRRFGMTSDSVVGAEMVLANSSIITVNETYNSDILYALKGGGNGNFGIITSISYIVHKIENNNKVCMYNAKWDDINSKEDYKNIIDVWQNWSPYVNSNLTSQMNLYNNTISSVGLFIGSCTELSTIVEPFLSNTTLVPTSSYQTYTFIDSVANLAGCGDPTNCLKSLTQRPMASPHSSSWKGKSAYTYHNQSISDEGLDIIYYFMNPNYRKCCGSNFGGIIMDAYGGKINEYPSNSSVFAHRNMGFHLQFLLYWDYHNISQSLVAKNWVSTFYNTLKPYLVPDAAYRNYIDNDLPNWQYQYYGNNYDFLQKMKLYLDPTNRFYFSQSVQLPSSIEE